MYIFLIKFVLQNLYKIIFRNYKQNKLKYIYLRKDGKSEKHLYISNTTLNSRTDFLQ